MSDDERGGHFRTDPPAETSPGPHTPTSGQRPRRWLPVAALAAGLAVTAFVAAAIAGGESGRDDDPFDGTSRQPPVDGTYTGTFLDSYFDALPDATVTENRLFVTVQDGAVVSITGGWVAQGVGAQFSEDGDLICTATFVAGHELRTAARLVDGLATTPVEFVLQRSDVEAVADSGGAECDPGLADSVELVRTAEIRLAGPTGEIQFFDDEGAARGLVALSQ